MKRPAAVVDVLPCWLLPRLPHAVVGIRPVAQRVLPQLALLAPFLGDEDVRVILVPRRLAVEGHDARGGGEARLERLRVDPSSVSAGHVDLHRARALAHIVKLGGGHCGCTGSFLHSRLIAPSDAEVLFFWARCRL